MGVGVTPWTDGAEFDCSNEAKEESRSLSFLLCVGVSLSSSSEKSFALENLMLIRALFSFVSYLGTRK